MTDLRDTNSSPLYRVQHSLLRSPGGTSYNGLDGKAPAQTGRLFQVSGIKRERERKSYIKEKGFHKLKYLKGVGKSVI